MTCDSTTHRSHTKAPLGKKTSHLGATRDWLSLKLGETRTFSHPPTLSAQEHFQVISTRAQHLRTYHSAIFDVSRHPDGEGITIKRFA
jgi:hypothetical protein